MKSPANKKQWFTILFPVTLIGVNVAALAKSPPNTFILVLGVSLGLTICIIVGGIVFWRINRKKKLLIPALNAARADGSTAYLYMVNSEIGLVTVDPRRELRLFTARKGKVHLQTTAPADMYTLGVDSYAVNATMVVEGLSLWAWDEKASNNGQVSIAAAADVTMLIIPDTKTKDEKSFREQAIQAMIRASKAPGVS